MAKISIIVPVYNVERYIRRCVGSILNQTYNDFDLILVDDGSPDNCGNICEEYAQQDDRIHVIHQQNGGLSAARNSGIDWALLNSDSQWLTFIDSDDWVLPEYLEQLHSAAESNDVKVSFCNFARTTGDTVQAERSVSAPRVCSPAEIWHEQRIPSTVAWGKLYKKECFTDIRYPVGKTNEDEFTTYRILFSMSQVAFIDYPLYQYFINPDGIMQNKWNPHRMDGIEAFETQISFFRDNKYLTLYNDVLYLYRWTLVNYYQTINDGSQENKRYRKEIKQKLRKLLSKKYVMFPFSEYKETYTIAFPTIINLFWYAIDKGRHFASIIKRRIRK